MEITYNVCEELVNEMKKLGCSENTINSIKNNDIFKEAYDKHYGLQRVMITTLLFKILMSGDFKVPANIRLLLNSANDTISWLDDIKLAIIPFIKENEDKLSFSF